MIEIAVAWFTREDWKEIKRICVDELQDTYDEWLADAERNSAELAARGFTVERVILRLADIRQRERVTGRKVDGRARSALAIKLHRNALKSRPTE